MFDIGFWELGVIGVVALLVVGPERLPALARSAGLWIGRLRRVASGFREDLERELHAEELKRSLVEERDALVNPIRQIGDELRSTINDTANNTTLNESTAGATGEAAPSSAAQRAGSGGSGAATRIDD